MSQLAQIVRDNITRFLVEQKISKNELSRRSGIAQAALVNLLNGEREIQTDTIQRIADALGIHVTELTMIHEHAA